VCKVLPVEIKADRFHYRIADGIGVSGAFPFYQFYTAVFDRYTESLFNGDVSFDRHDGAIFQGLQVSTRIGDVDVGSVSNRDVQ
jgi:hypothetical protein